jgi:hypothetical protein
VATGAIDVTLTTNACASSGDSWFSAQVTGIGTATPLLLQGTLVEIIGTPGDLGYIFRGGVSPAADASPAAAALLDGATQFVAQLAVTEPANTAQLTVVFLSPTATASAGSVADQSASAGGTASVADQSASAGGTASDAQPSAASPPVSAPTEATDGAISQAAAPWTATAQSLAVSRMLGGTLGATGSPTIVTVPLGLPGGGSVPSLAGLG